MNRSTLRQVFHPKLLTVLKEGYTLATFWADLTAGVIVAIVALPLAIAFAIASGVNPAQGLTTAIVAGGVAALLSGSRTQVSGPTGAFIVIIYGVVQQYGYEGLAVATLIAGVLLVIMGIARMGVLLKFIPYPVTIGFTGGIALIIFSGQIRDLLGLPVESLPAHAVDQWIVYGGALAGTSLSALTIGVAAIAILTLWPRVTHRIPGSIVAIVVLTAVVHVLDLPVATVGSRFGEVPNHLPDMQFRTVSWDLFKAMFSPAITIALLAALESLLSAVVADGMTGTRHRPNTELISIGVANIIVPAFNGIPATGAIARTATNIRNGGRTPVAALVHAVVLLLIMMLFGSWASLIPMPVLAAILMVVAYHMSEWRSFKRMLKSPKGDVAVLLSTFLLTVVIDLTVAIQVGVVLAAFLFLQRMSDVTQIGSITKDLRTSDPDDTEDQGALSGRHVPAGVEVFEIQGTLFFGVIEQFKDAMRLVERPPDVLILRMRNVLSVDASGIRALEELHRDSERQGTTLLISGIHSQPLVALERAGLLDVIGGKNINGNIDEALQRAGEILDTKRHRAAVR
ncbi:MAG: SulP family inorganic anion transporter [Bacteroidetes bacterium]|jgi:SulP family sulfate permease|nr:SulP family inorganic anion transporter [Bacteroidota bacterium]